MANSDTLILVDKDDKEIGQEEKLNCHLGNGKLHRAFSIFIFNSKGEMLLQRRANNKMLWPGFWTNTCCSHPRKGETLEIATHRRLKEELGFDCPLKEIFFFTYNAKFKEVGSENELDHVFIGKYDNQIEPNAEEVLEYTWITPEKLKDEVKRKDYAFTPWFKMIFEKVLEHHKG